MLTQVMLSQTDGKTIKSVKADSSSQLIVFTDGTFVYQVAENEYNSLYIQEPKFKIFDYYCEEAIDAGVFTREEYDTACKEREQAQDALRMKQQREHYEKLKKIFDRG